jgi:hypothetical protein
MRKRLPPLLSAAALVVALLGATPLGEAARNVVPLALFAKNADKVDGINASRIARPGYLLPLGKDGRFPITVGAIGPAGEKGPPGPAGSPGLTGLQLISADTGADSSSPKAGQALCPVGKKAIAGGAELSSGAYGNPVALQDSRPLVDDTGWHATATEIDTYTPSWALRVWAVCATTA